MPEPSAHRETPTRTPGHGSSATEPGGRTLRTPAAVGVGLVGGTIGAVLGGGTGSITVPSLDKFTDLPRATIHGTSTIPNIAVAAVAATVYWLRGGAIDLLAGVPLVLGGIVGAVSGARLVLRAPETALRCAFATVLLLAGTKMMLDSTVLDLAGHTAVLPEQARTPAVMVALCLVVGVVIGAWASAMGVGGGLLTVPTLVLLFGLDLHVAVGTALMVMLPNSLVGATAHIRQRTAAVPLGTRIAAGAGVGAIGGAFLSLALDAAVLRVVVACYLLFTSGRETVRLVQRHIRRTSRSRGGTAG